MILTSVVGLIKRHWGISLILALFVALGATFSVVVPIFEASDELWHYPFVKHLADGNGLPVQDASADQSWRQEGSQPPLYYALSALATFWIDTDDAYESHPPLLWYNPHVDNGVLTTDGNTNLVVHSQQEAFPWHGTALAVHLIRFLSVLLGAATVLLTYLLALEILPGCRYLALGAAAVNAFTPMFLFISGAVNNDNLVVPLCSLALLMMVKTKPKAQSSKLKPFVIGHLALGFILGLAALTKESALGLFPLALLAVAVRIWHQHRNAPLLKRFGLVIGHWSLVILPALAVSGWWYWRNWRLYGDPLGLNVFLDILGRRHPPATLRQLWGEREGFAMSYWGLFGGVNVPLDTWVYRLLNLLAIVAAIGVIIFLIRKFSRSQATSRGGSHAAETRAWEPALLHNCDVLKLIRDRLRPEAWMEVVILLAWPTIVFTSLIRWALQTWSSQGRLVFSAISAFSILLFLGLSQFVPRRYTKMLACLVGGLMFVIAAIAPFRYIAPAYAKPPLLSETEIQTIPNRLDISFGGVMKLLGYDLQIPNTQYPISSNLMPGDALTVTLYWQSLANMNQDYSTFVHLLDENELVVAQRDMYPGQGLYPTSLWSIGDTIANRYVLLLPETAFAPNEAQLEVGLYNFATGERLMADGPSGDPLGDNVRFQEIEILPRAEAEVPNPVNFNFGNRIALIGYDMDRRTAWPGETIHLTLYWQALAEMKEDYTVFTHVLGEENRIWAQKDNWPKDGDAPTSTWEPGQTIADEYELVFDPDTPLDAYDVEIGLYLAATGERLRIVGQGGQLLDDRVLLSKVRVASKTPPPPPPTPTADCYPTRAAIILDTGWRFRTDPDDVGLMEGWASPAFNDADWQALAPGKPWEYSGLEYDGMAWYRTQVTLPDWSAVYLGFGRVDDVATLWVEGKRIPASEGLSSGVVVLDLLEFGNPGDQLHLALRVEDQGGYGGIGQPLRLGCEPRAVITSAQYVTWLADLYPAWPMPAWARGRPVAWTMAGQENAADEALLSSDGAVAPWATAPTAEVWLYDPATGELAYGAQNDILFSLANDHLPIPQWEWDAFGVTLKNALFGDVADSAVRWQVIVNNVSDTKRELTLLVTVRPLAINWGIAPIYAIGLRGTPSRKAHLWVNGELFMVAITPPEEAGVELLAQAMAVVTQGRVPDEETIASAPAGDAAAVWAYPLSLDAGQSTAFSFAFPAAPGAPFPVAGSDVEARLTEAIAAWEKATGQVTIDLPDDLVERGAPASIGYLLLALDPDGPHPGPLAHDALWVRDAAYIGLALLQFGHADAVRAYIPAVWAAQETDGRVPPIQGEDIPWEDDEWDAQGQAIFLVTSYYRYTGDQATLRQWYPALRAAARFITELRASQADPSATLRTGSTGPAQGLLPPSKSAEDLGPSDWHHYWDDFWAVAGLEEAAYAARELGEMEDTAWMQAEANALREAILASVEAVMGPEPAYIPGAVESVEGSAMARGTVPALWPVEVLPREMPLLTRSFDYYHQLWIEPHEGAFRHHGGQFWPYGGLELAHAYLRLGRMDALHQILGWTLGHQTLPGTFAWAEQVSPTNGGFSGGDMPHAWAAASYATLVREMLVSERDDALELFNGVPDWWLGAGQVIVLEDAPTHFGEVNLRTESTVQQTDATWNGTLTLTLSGATPPNGFRWRLPPRPAVADGPPGTAIVGDWLVVPSKGGTVRLTFTPDR